MNAGDIVPSVNLLHQISLFKDLWYSAVIFTHFASNVVEMYLQLKYIDFYNKDYIANIIQKNNTSVLHIATLRALSFAAYYHAYC